MSDVLPFGDLTLKVLRPADDLPELVEKIQFNFDQILLHGGGPAGEQGIQGISIIGATGFGEEGEPGPRGSYIWFVGVTLVNGTPVINPEHLLNDVIIDASGNFFQVVSDGAGGLEYEFQFNINTASLLTYLINQYDYQNLSGDPITKWVLRDNDAPSSNQERNLVLAKREENSGNPAEDQTEFYRLMLGLDAYVGTNNAPLTICNIIPEGVVNAQSSPFNHIQFRYRDSITSTPSATQAILKYSVVSGKTVFSAENLSTSIFLEHDNANTDDSEVKVKGKTFNLIGDSPDNFTVTEYLKFVIGEDLSIITAQKDLTFEADDVDGIIRMQNLVEINARIALSTDTNATLTNISGNAIDISHKRSSMSLPAGQLKTINGGYHGQIFTIKAHSSFVDVIDRNISGTGNIIIGSRSVMTLREGETMMFQYIIKANLSSATIGLPDEYVIEIGSSNSLFVTKKYSNIPTLTGYTYPGMIKIRLEPGWIDTTSPFREFPKLLDEIRSGRTGHGTEWDILLQIQIDGEDKNNVIQIIECIDTSVDGSDPIQNADILRFKRHKRNVAGYANTWSPWEQIHSSTELRSIRGGRSRIDDIPVVNTIQSSGTGGTYYIVLNENHTYFIFEDPGTGGSPLIINGIDTDTGSVAGMGSDVWIMFRDSVTLRNRLTDMGLRIGDGEDITISPGMLVRFTRANDPGVDVWYVNTTTTIADKSKFGLTRLASTSGVHAYEDEDDTGQALGTRVAWTNFPKVYARCEYNVGDVIDRGDIRFIPFSSGLTPDGSGMTPDTNYLIWGNIIFNAGSGVSDSNNGTVVWHVIAKTTLGVFISFSEFSAKTQSISFEFMAVNSIGFTF